MNTTSRRREFLEGQPTHWMLLVLLLALAWGFGHPWTNDTRLLGIGAGGWFALSLAIPAVHQIYIWAVWRIELLYKGVSQPLGRYAFPVYAADFLILLSARPITLFCLAWTDRGSLSLPPSIGVSLALPMLPLLIYTLYSVFRYFGVSRAMGKDHFDPEIRRLGKVRRGVFRYVPNAMYTFAFLFLWIIAIALDSRSALIVAAFQHCYIWVHYFCTERPDMRRIYGE